MGISTIEYQVTCDQPGCEAVGPRAFTPGQARTEAHFSGFKVEPHPSSAALCSEHKPKEDDSESK